MAESLPEEVRKGFDSWLEAAVGRYVPPLTFTEVRKGVQALSSLYVERRSGGGLGPRSHEGQGKRAALATYFGPLHFLTVHHAMSGFGRFDERARIVDLGTGTGASGAAAALRLDAVPEILGIDRSGWMLSEARRTWSAFGLRGRAVRGRLPGAFPRIRPTDLIVLGWVVNELEGTEREGLLEKLVSAVGRGARLLVAEPLAERITPWWPDWVRTLGGVGLEEGMVRVAIERHPWIRDLDRASGLDHRTIGARLLAGPLPSG
jgi:precorrin-6B methylase 2